MKKLLSLALVSLMLFCSCNNAKNDLENGTKAEEAKIAVTESLTEDEMEIWANMPEIVFVLSHNYRGYNILGYYITKYGEIKLFDFRDESNYETYDIFNVYDRLEEVTVLEIESHPTPHAVPINLNEVTAIPISKIIEYYQELLLIDAETDLQFTEREFKPGIIHNGDMGYYNLYGARNSETNQAELLLLDFFGGDHRWLVQHQFSKNVRELFPDLELIRSYLADKHHVFWEYYYEWFENYGKYQQ